MDKIDKFEQRISAPKALKANKTTLFLGKANHLTKYIQLFESHYETSIKLAEDLEDGFEYVMKNPTSLCIIDLDSFSEKNLGRIFEIINFTQTPTLLLSDEKSEIMLPLTHPFCLSCISPQDDFLEKVKEVLKQTNTKLKIAQRMKSFSLGHKPKLFYLVAALLIVEPFIKIFYMKIHTGFDFKTVFETILSMDSFISSFEFWLMFPVAGLALIMERSWSLLVFIGLQVYILFSMIFYTEFNWPYVADSPHLSSQFLLLINSVLIAYLLVPAHRRPYWNKAHKMWRNTARFATQLPVFIKTSFNDRRYTTITNISESGAYFEVDENLAVGGTTKLEMFLGGKVTNLDATIKRSVNTVDDKTYGYGVEFNNLSDEHKEALKNYIGTLSDKLQ